MAEKKPQLKQTKGKFKLVGIVNGTTRNNFLGTRTFDSGRTKNECSFGVKTNEENESWVKVEGFDSEQARFSKWDNEAKKLYQESVAWSKRDEFKEEGYNPMFGIRVAVEDDVDNEGKFVSKNMFAYDVPDELELYLDDGDAIYVEGVTSFTSYTDKEGVKSKYKNLKPTKILKNAKAVDFESEKFKEQNIFEQELVFLSLEKDPNDKERFVLECYIVNYNNVIERVEFILTNKKLASNLRKNLKPYNSIKVLGRLENKIDTEEVEASGDTWGDDEADFSTAKAPIIREFVITKAYPDTIDKKTYSEEIIQNVLKASDDFGKEEWADDDDDDDDDAWD